MSLKDYEPRIAKSALHRKEEHVKQVFRDQVAEAAGLLEVVLSAIVLVALLLSVAPLLQLLPGLLTHGNSVEVREFLERRWILSSALSLSRCWPNTAPAACWKCCCMPSPAT